MLTLLARLYLRLGRWTVVETPEPFADRMVLVAAPHTSNWDFPLTLAAGRVSGLRIRWLGKAALFRFPFGGFMRAIGGIPVDRSAATGMVAQMATALKRFDRICLVVPAEGTRSKAEYWKSGFYRIAETADVPIILGFIDKSTRTTGFGPQIRPSGDVVADMDRIRAFYDGKEGLKPGRFGPIRLREESAEPIS